MSKENSQKQALQTYLEAADVLVPYLSGVMVLGLLRGAFESGMLALAQKPCSPAQIATALNMEESLVVNICIALDAYKIFEQENGHYQLAEKWIVLTAPDAVLLFQDMLNNVFTSSEVLARSAANEEDYWTMTPKNQIALAKGATFNPASPESPPVFKTLFMELIPEIHAIFEAGGHYLELGCGIGGFLLSFLQAYPTMTAVGIDLAPDVLGEARKNAFELKVNERVVFHECDACDFIEPGNFDIVFWSQFFFASEKRTDVLQVAMQSLKPGGILFAPLQGEPSIIEEDLHTEAGQFYATSRIIFGGWDIPSLSAEDLQHEIESAGFTVTKLVEKLNLRIIVAQRP